MKKRAPVSQRSAAEEIELRKALYAPKSQPAKYRECPDCGGSGGNRNGNWCSPCKGSGRVEVDHVRR